MVLAGARKRLAALSSSATLAHMSLASLQVRALEGLVHTLDAVAASRPAPGAEQQAEHIETGRAGELAAFFYLRRLGYTVVARDWKSPRAPGDIDLIGWDDDTLCFVEVKTRTTRDVATAEAAVDEHKRRTLRKLAGYYVRNLPDGTPTRFDVVAVYLGGALSAKQDRAVDIELFRGGFAWM